MANHEERQNRLHQVSATCLLLEVLQGKLTLRNGDLSEAVSALIRNLLEILEFESPRVLIQEVQKQNSIAPPQLSIKS